MNRKSRTSLFLMELIISILLFSVTGAVCIQLFVNTHLTSKQTKVLQFAVIAAQNEAEQIRAGVSDIENKNIYYDEVFTPCTAENAAYLLVIQQKEQASVLNVTINFTDLSKQETIHEISFRKFLSTKTEADTGKEAP